MDPHYDPYFVIEDLLPGETIQRRYRTHYPQAVEGMRKQPIDLGTCRELQSILASVMYAYTDWRKQQLELAFVHLTDAMNDDLPLVAREQHFDIAGALVWNAYSPHGYHNAVEGDKIAQWFRIWQKAGGI